jgi:hypothetical protein
MDLKEIRWNPVNLIELGQDREKWGTVVRRGMKLGDLKNYANPFKD